MSRNFLIRNKTRGKVPPIPFAKIKDAILGSGYDLSLALVTPKEARTITLKSKHKDKASNVLAFPLSEKSGEIIICPATARVQAPQYGHPYRNFLPRLFIHGCFHLAGYTHGGTMEKLEDQIAKQFDF